MKKIDASHGVTSEKFLNLPNIEQIIEDSPLIVTPNTLVSEVIKLMSQAGSSCQQPESNSFYRSGLQGQRNQSCCALVVESQTLLGIFTVRDVLRITAKEINLSQITVASVMTRGVIFLTLSNYENPLTALDLMRQYGISNLPILNEQGQLLGIITKNRILDLLNPLEMASTIAKLDQTNSNLRSYICTQKQQVSKLNDILNNVFAAIVSLRSFTNGDWEQEYVSAGCEEIFGYTQHELMADKYLWWERVYPEDREKVIKPHFNDFLLGRQNQIDYRFYHKDGSLRWITSAYNSRHDQDRNCWITTIVNRDITERKLTEAALQDSEERYRSVIKAMREGIVVQDASCKIITCNASAERILGLTKEQIIGRASVDARWRAIHEDGSPFPGENHPAMVTLRTGTPCVNVVMGVHKPNGELSWILINSEPLFKPGAATPYAVVTSFSDITRRKEAEAALQASEFSYRTLAENLPAIVYRLFPAENNRIVFFNNMVHTMFGYTNEDLCHQEVCSIDSLIVAEDKVKIAATVKDAIAKNQLFQIEYRIRDKAGKIRYCWEQGRPIQNTDGQVSHIDGVIFDITKNKLVEEALHQSNDRLMLALEAANMGSWDWNIITNEVLWTPIHEIIFGYEPGTAKRTYKDWFSRVHPEDLPQAEACLQAAMKNHHVYHHQYRIILPNHEVRWVAAFGHFYYDSDHQPIRMLGMLYDITHQKLAEEKIHEQAALLDIATDAICVRDLEDRILFWNQGAENLYGYSATEIIGENANKIFYKDSSMLELAIKTTIESGSWQGELTQEKKDGTKVIVASRWTLMRSNTGQPKSILIVDTNITEKKHLEQQYYRAQRLESLGTLASGIAHDLNNILTPILAVSQLLPLKLKNLDPRLQELLKMQEINAKRAGELVKQILSFARGAEGKKTVVQPKHLLLEICQIIKGTFPKSIEIEKRIGDNLATVFADATQLHQILMNLVVNARDAMPYGGKLTIAGDNFYIDESYANMNIEAKVGNYILITITDTGTGISPENIDRIFDPFFTTKDVGKGTGLGLSTTIGIIRNHGGFIHVYSELGKGSRFQVYLPAINDKVSQIVESQLLPGKGELILVVDDETVIAETTKFTLENYNYRVLKANDGIDAILLYAQHKDEIDVVLLDMMMPIMDGENTIRTLQKINPNVQIIAMSGLGTAAMIEKAAINGVKQFLLKPFTAQELLNSLHSVLNDIQSA